MVAYGGSALRRPVFWGNLSSSGGFDIEGVGQPGDDLQAGKVRSFFELTEVAAAYLRICTQGRLATGLWRGADGADLWRTPRVDPCEKRNHLLKICTSIY